MNNSAEATSTAVATDEVDRQMSPSRWSRRGNADQVIGSHCAVLAETSAAVRDSASASSVLNAEYAVARTGRSLTLDLIMPEAQRSTPTVVIYIHGGMW